MGFKSIALAATVLTLSTSANAATYNFYQGGYSEGAFISGTFTAEDTDFDNQLSFVNEEITDLTLSFSGNSIISAFNINYSTLDLANLVYDLHDGTSLGDGVINSPEGEGIFVSDSINEVGYFAGEAATIALLTIDPFTVACVNGGTCGGVFSAAAEDYTSEFVEVSSVPVPAAFWLFGSGLLGLIGVARRKKV